MSQTDVINLLFEPGEQTCITKAPTGVELFPAELLGESPNWQYFSINAMRGHRADANVVSYRNILLEFDTGTREQQLSKILELEIPISAVTWSGNKSCHAIISLAPPLETRAEYDALVRRIYDRVPGVDKSCKNPSRLSRVPGATNQVTLRPQELLGLGRRTTLEELEVWLGPDSPDELPLALGVSKGEPPSGLSPWTNSFLRWGAPEGSRNSTLFKAACDMARNGYTEAQVWELVTIVLDLPASEMRQCIRSAFRASKK
jgi:hypothetical protein